MMKDVVARIRKNYTYFAALIGLGFLWTGTAYIIQAYRLLELLDGATVNLLTCGAYYACQAAGIGAVALFFAKRPAAAGGRLLPLIATIAALVFTAASLLASAPAVIIAVGVLLNIAIGVLSGCYLTRLATDIPQQRRGIVFGGAYAFGSIGTWLISLPMGGRFLWNDGSFFAVAILAALSLLLLRRLPSLPKMEPAGGHSQGRFTGKLIFLAAAVLFLLSMENTLGFAFPLGGAKDSVYIEFTRAFYGVGLIIAGVVSDQNRRWGAVCCLAALAFPFAAMALGGSVGGETAMWMLAYLVLGFWSVYRILVFSDISGKTGLPLWAVFGLLAGRLGEAAGTLGADLFSDTPLVILSGAVFVLVIALFFVLYQKLYTAAISPEEAEKRRLSEYVHRFGLSAREQEIFSLIIQGLSNAEMASSLYITESTVKFHVGNILKKTEFASRLELIADYKLGSKA
jgi:DNA-binding CsgD family transcriptional regulator/MFS family permease